MSIDNAPNPSQLFKSISEAMEAVDRIPKNGTNAFHGYKYATEADVSDAIRKELASRDVALFIGNRITDVREWQTPGGKATLITNVECTLTFACGKTGATHTITASGTGDDPSDKGTYKAITGAVKYALLKTFLVPTGDDPEQAAQHQREQSAAIDAAFSGKAVTPPQKPATAPLKAQWPDGTPDTPPNATDALQAAFDATTTGDDYTFAFGKWKGKQLHEVEASYLDWLLKQPAKEGFEQQHAEQHAMFRRELARREQVPA